MTFFSKIIQERGGLLWESFFLIKKKRMLSVHEADNLSYENGYLCAERLVEAMKKKEINSCDGGHLTINPVKILPISSNGGNVIVCYGCFLKELKDRTKKAKVNGADKYEFPKWDELKRHEAE